MSEVPTPPDGENVFELSCGCVVLLLVFVTLLFLAVVLIDSAWRLH